jgi:hypothetical protein
MPPGVAILRTQKQNKTKKSSPSKSWRCCRLQERKEKRMFKGKGEIIIMMMMKSVHPMHDKNSDNGNLNIPWERFSSGTHYSSR